MSAEARSPLGRVGWALGTGAVAMAVLAVGAAIPTHPKLAVVACVGVLVAGVTVLQPAVTPLVAMTALIVVQRVALPGVDLSASDFVLFVAIWPALLVAGRGYSPPMRNLLWLAAIYQVATLFAVVYHPYRANTIDWFHSGMLVAGALIVGWAVGRQGYAGLGLGLVLAVALVIAAGTIVQGTVQYAGGDFTAIYPTWPFAMHKNFAGTTLAAVALIAYLHPPWLGWNRNLAIAAFWVCIVAVGFTQSRQAVGALGVALAFVVLRRDPDRTRSKLGLVTIPPGIAFVAFTVKQQIESGNNFNSLFQRVTWFGQSIDVWQSSPWFGAGLRWWYTDRFPVKFQPPNAELEVLTTAGLVGLAAFLVMVVGVLITLTRLDPRYGTLALALMLDRLVEGQFDIFWVSVTTSLPFAVAGVCLGAQALAQAEEAGAPPGAVDAPLEEAHPR